MTKVNNEPNRTWLTLFSREGWYGIIYGRMFLLRAAADLARIFFGCSLGQIKSERAPASSGKILF